MQEANAVFWFGRDLETFLEKPIEALSSNANVVKLLDTDGLLKLEFREGGPFSEHDHDDHDDHDDTMITKTMMTMMTMMTQRP